MSDDSKVNGGIEIDVRISYLWQQSDPAAGRYVFAYHISISNRGDSAAQLISRHWVITDGDDNVQEVRGDGVIGEQPEIQPGQTYQYSSGAILETDSGQMEGSYLMRRASGEEFQATIPMFALLLPSALH